MATKDVRAPRRSLRPTAPETHSEIATLRRLFAAQVEHIARRPNLAGEASMEYLSAHFAMDLTLDRHLRAVEQMIPSIRGRVLEWGCRHALDSCVYRMRMGSAVELHGCDVCGPEVYRPFHEFAGLDYVQLRDTVQLPYSSETFDVVTSNGVLEHVDDDAGSAAEVFRVLKPGGTFAVTCLPNRLSYTEAFQRWRGDTAHDRLYTIRSASAILRSSGFVVEQTGRFLMLPTMLNGFPPAIKAFYQRARPAVAVANRVLEWTWPVNLLASNLMIVARKPAVEANNRLP